MKQVVSLTVDDFESQFRPEINKNINVNGKRPIENVDSMLNNMPFTQLEEETEMYFLTHDAVALDASDIIVRNPITNAKLKCTIFISNY